MVDKPGTYIKNYDSSDASTASLIKIYEKENISSMSKKDILSYLEKIEGSLNQQITVSDFNLFQDKVTVDTNLKCQLIFVLDDTLDWQIEKLGIVLKNDQYSSKLNTMSYIDLRFGNQAIIK